MKKSKIILLSLTTLLAGVALVSCVKTGEKNKGFVGKPVKIKDGFKDVRANIKDPDVNKPLIEKNGKKYYQVAGLEVEVQDTLTTFYTADVHESDKFNYLKAGHVESSDIYASMVDGLFDNTRSKRLVGMLAVAEKYDNSNHDKPVYSFQIRPEVPWVVNSTGKIYEVDGKKQFVKAEDFVEAVFYNLTVQGTNVFLFNTFIDGAEEFNTWALNDENIKKTEEEKRAKFKELVGVYATGEDVINYRLKGNVPFFKTITTYSPYYPVNRHYLKEQGSNFGSSQNHILVSGAYRITKYDKQVEYVYEPNDHYWDKEHVYIKKITNKFLKSGLAADYPRLAFEKGEVDGFNVSPADKEGWNKYIGEGNDVQTPKSDQVTPLHAFGNSIFFWFFRFNRQKFEYNNLPAKTKEQLTATAEAVKNKDFRLGFLRGLEFVESNKLIKKTPHENIYRRYVVDGLAYDQDNVDYTKYFDEVYNRENKTSFTLTGYETGFDPVHDADKAKKHFETAYKELDAKKVQFPILIDMIGSIDILGKQILINRVNQLQQLAKEAAGGNEFIQIRLNYPQNDTQHNQWLYNYNYDFGSTGWGPDYADPKTYLDTLTLNGDYAEHFGLSFKPGREEDKATEALAKELFGKYDAAVKKAYKIEDQKERFKALAEAEYDIIYNQGLIHPYNRAGGTTASVSKIINFQAAKVAYGNNSSRMKNAVVAKEVLPRADKLKIVKDFNRLTGKKTEEVTINFYNKDGILFDNEQFKGLPEALTVTKDLNVKLPEGINLKDKKIVTKWYTDQELTKPVELSHNLFKATSNVTLYGKEESLKVVKDLSITFADGGIAKAGAIDDKIEYPIFADSDKGHNISYEVSFTEGQKRNIDDHIEVEVLPANAKDEKDVKAAKILKSSGIVLDKAGKKVIVQYQKSHEDLSLLGAKVLVNIKLNNYTTSEDKAVSKTVKLFFAGVKPEFSPVFEGETVGLEEVLGNAGLKSSIKLVDSKEAKLTDKKISGLKEGSVKVEVTITGDKINDYKTTLVIDVLKQVASRPSHKAETQTTLDFNEEGKKLTFESSNQAAASFENGVLTLKQVGQEVTITIKKDGQPYRLFKIEITSAFLKQAKKVLPSIKNEIEAKKLDPKNEKLIAFKKATETLEKLLEKWNSSEESLKAAYNAFVGAFLAIE